MSLRLQLASVRLSASNILRLLLPNWPEAARNFGTKDVLAGIITAEIFAARLMLFS